MALMLFLCCVLTSAFIICIYVPSPLYCINDQHDVKGGVKINVLHYKT